MGLRGQRLEDEGWGDGIIAKYVDLLSTRVRKGSIFGFFHPETRFQKSVLTGTVFSLHARLHTKAFPCGPSVSPQAKWFAYTAIVDRCSACK